MADWSDLDVIKSGADVEVSLEPVNLYLPIKLSVLQVIQSMAVEFDSVFNESFILGLEDRSHALTKRWANERDQLFIRPIVYAQLTHGIANAREKSRSGIRHRSVEIEEEGGFGHFGIKWRAL